MNRIRWTGILIGSLAALLLVAGAFAMTGLTAEWRRPDSAVTAAAALQRAPDTVRVAAWNIAKCGAVKSDGWRSDTDVRAHLDSIAAVLDPLDPHLVFLSEVNVESGPNRVHQVRYLAEKLEMHAWAFGENYRWGLPGLRVRSGNAVLSRFPLAADSVMQLPGGTPFYAPTNNRRLLWARVKLGRGWVTVASLRNDSFRRDNNRRQAARILDVLPPGPVLLAGDFNAAPGEPSIDLFVESGRFAAVWDGPPTFPSRAPREAIDLILAPSDWEILDHRVVGSPWSDHLPVLTAFRPDSGRPPLTKRPLF